jgi:hypothetical protein
LATKSLAIALDLFQEGVPAALDLLLAGLLLRCAPRVDPSSTRVNGFFGCAPPFFPGLPLFSDLV